MKKKEKYENIHSEELQDIISLPPSWLLKRGIGFVFATVLILLGISFIIKYPDTVKTTLVINATNPPTVVKNKISGSIGKMLKKEGMKVEKNEVLAILESDVAYNEALGVEKILFEIVHSKIKPTDIKLPLYTHLGQLQILYQKFCTSFNNYLKFDNSANRVEFLRLADSLSVLINNWKGQYLLTAPISGRFYYYGAVDVSQHIEANTTVFFVSPENVAFYGIVNIPEESIGKIKVGQQAQIKLKSYPFEEYGVVFGEITSINHFSHKDSYMSKIKILKLPKGSLIVLKHGMTADVDILTTEYSIFKRIRINLRHSLSL